MLVRVFVGVLCACALSGCASVVPFIIPQDEHGGPTVANVVAKIECEIAEARDDPENSNPQFIATLHSLGLADFSQWAASATVSLTVSDTEGLSPNAGLSLTYIEPFKLAGQSFTFGGNALLYQQRQRVFTQTYTIKIGNIPHETCADLRAWNAFNLEGDLGLKDQIYIGLHTFPRAASKDVAPARYIPTQTGQTSPDSFGGTVSFDVFKGITSLGPTWTITNFKGLGGGVGYQRDDLDKLVISFAPASYQPPKKNEKVAKFNARRAAATTDAVDAARIANSQLINTSAIQQLGQILSAH